jgi:hypothetical protein
VAISSEERKKIEEVIAQGVEAGVFIKHGHGHRVTYCKDCGLNHPKQWYSISGSDGRFYACFVKRPVIVVGDSGTDFTVVSLKQFAERHLPPGFVQQLLDRGFEFGIELFGFALKGKLPSKK